MRNPQDKGKLRVILIGGSSNVGKSTLAEFMAQKLGWQHRSTDYLARHPGRPWRVKDREVPPHVAEHYLTLSTQALLADVLCHYKGLQPMIQNIIHTHAEDLTTGPLILEGSALWPAYVTPLNHKNAAVLWLTAKDDLFKERIYANSQFESVSPHEKFLIQKFLDRTIYYNQRMVAVIDQLGLLKLEIEGTETQGELADRCLERLGFLFP